MRVLAAFLLITTALAGCASEPVPVPEPEVELDPFQLAAGGIPDVSALWDVVADVDWWEDFVSAGKRDAYLPDTPATFSGASRDAIAARFSEMGAEVRIESFDGGALGIPVPTAEAAVVIGHFPGTGERTIAFGGHYDTQAGTIEGAYDNGSGVAAILSICGILSQINLTHSVDCLLFDAEEVGAVASGAYVDAHPDLPYDLYLGYDMIGLNCPGHDWKIYQWVDGNSAAWLHPFVSKVTHNVTGLAMDCAEVFDFNDRNSDERNFYSAGIPTVRFAGGRSAGDYDQYHMPDDTPEHLYELAGGRDNWELGYANIVESSVHLALMFDALGREQIEV